MPASEKTKASLAPAAALVPADANAKSLPVWLARDPAWMTDAGLSDQQKTWIDAQALKGPARKHALLPAADGGLAGVVLWLGEARAGDPMDRPELALGALPG